MTSKKNNDKPPAKTKPSLTLLERQRAALTAPYKKSSPAEKSKGK